MNPEKAKKALKTYIINTFSPEEEFEVYIVWQCKTLQNWKFMMSSTIEDGRYYELTYSGDNNEYYLDMYKKEDGVVVKCYS